MDEMQTFVGQCKNKVWRWLAVERATRRIVAWVLGYRDATTARRWWQALPVRYQQHTTYYTDQRVGGICCIKCEFKFALMPIV